MTPDSRRLMIFCTSSIVSDPFNCAPVNGLMPGRVALHWPEVRSARDVPLAAGIVSPAVRAAFDELKFGLG